jgi:hypothetical protein
VAARTLGVDFLAPTASRSALADPGGLAERLSAHVSKTASKAITAPIGTHRRSVASDGTGGTSGNLYSATSALVYLPVAEPELKLERSHPLHFCRKHWKSFVPSVQVVPVWQDIICPPGHGCGGAIGLHTTGQVPS